MLTYAATSKQFDIKDEIERRDDLDNQPDDDRSPIEDSVKIYLEDVEFFLLTLDRLSRSKRFDFESDSIYVEKTSVLPCVQNNVAGNYVPKKFFSSNANANVWVDLFSRNMEFGYSLGDCVFEDVLELGQKDVTKTKYRFSIDKGTFETEIVVEKRSEARVASLVPLLKELFRSDARQSLDAIRKQVSLSTDVSARSHELMIRTQFPRGSLPDLFSHRSN